MNVWKTPTMTCGEVVIKRKYRCVERRNKKREEEDAKRGGDLRSYLANKFNLRQFDPFIYPFVRLRLHNWIGPDYILKWVT